METTAAFLRDPSAAASIDRRHIDTIPQKGRRRVPGPLRQRWKSHRNGLQTIFRLGENVYKVYDPTLPSAPRRSWGIARSGPLTVALAAAIPEVVPMSGLLVDGDPEEPRVVGYWMPFVAGARILGPARLRSARDLFVRIDTWLVARGYYWRDPKRSNFIWDVAHKQARVVDLKHVVPLERGPFEPEHMRNSPRTAKLLALGVQVDEQEQMAGRREAYWADLDRQSACAGQR